MTQVWSRIPRLHPMPYTTFDRLSRSLIYILNNRKCILAYYIVGYVTDVIITIRLVANVRKMCRCGVDASLHLAPACFVVPSHLTRSLSVINSAFCIRMLLNVV